MSVKGILGFAVVGLLLIIGLSGRLGSSAGQASAAAAPPAYAPAIASPTPACGPAWNVISTTNILTQTNQFLGISAADANHVWAVGDYVIGNITSPTNRTLIQQWDGTQWNVVSSPNASAADNSLYGVAAMAITDVWAVGSYSSTHAYQTLTEHWDGASWQVITSANVVTNNDNLLYSVAGMGSTRWAVGGYKTIGDYLTLAEVWNGSSWQVVSSASPGSGDNVLLGVSASVSGTWAVGYWANAQGGTRQTLIEQWNGTSWQQVSSPNVGTGDNVLDGVVATSDGNAWAVGYSNNANGAVPLIERWNGTSWQVVTNPAFGVAALLTSIAANAPNDIWAAGGSLSGLNVSSPESLKHLTPNRVTSFDTLIEHWNGTAWSVSPSPSIGNDSYLNGVTTVSSNDAWTAGYYNNANSVGQTLAERYTGTCPPSPTPTNTPTITPTPAVTATPTDCPNPFTDITGNIFYTAIHTLNCRGVINGTDATHYSPGGTSTRGQFAKVVVLGFGLPFYTPMSGQDFTDVPASYFAYVYIETGYHAGILGGFDANSCATHNAQFPCYLPNIPITRGQLTKLVVNAGGYTLITPAAGPTFIDVPPSNVFYVSIETAAANHIVGGYSDHTFRPNNNIRRDEMAQIVYAGIVNKP